MSSENVETWRVVSRAVRRAAQAMDAFDKLHGPDTVIDMLVDTMHWCQRCEVDFEAARKTAERHFAAEGGHHYRRP
jgi:hypothetical protein